MTEPIETETPVSSEQQAPDGHYYASIAGRRILVKNISSAQSMIVAGILREARKGGGWEVSMDMLATISRLLDKLIVEEDDRLWLRDAIIDGDVQVEDIAFIWVAVATASEETKKRRPKRGR